MSILDKIKLDENSLFFVILLVFTAAVCPTVYVGDSGIFQAASFSLGSAHPPGYPLFISLGKLFTFIPFGNIAFKTNLVSVFFGVLTCLIVFRTSLELTANRHASWAASLICGISPLFFKQSVAAEVFTLNGFLSMTVFYLGLRLLRGGDFIRNSLLGFFIIGLGMANHHTIGFMGPIFLVPVALRWKEIDIKWLVISVLVFLAGFSANLLLYLRSAAMDHSGGLIVYSYAGKWHDFIKVLLRENYKGSGTPATLAATFSLGAGWYYGLKNSLLHVAFVNAKPVLPFLLLGPAYLWKEKKVLLYFLIAFVVWFGFPGKMVWAVPNLTDLDVQVIARYFFPAVPILYCLTAAGFAFLIRLLNRISSTMLPLFISYAVVAFPFALLPYSIQLSALDKQYLAYYYSKDMLTSLPEKSLLMNYSDNAIFTAFYMRAVERLREDVVVMDTAGEKDAYGLESSPAWKYATLYPGFYGASRSKLSQIDAEFALKGKLFVNSPLSLTRAVSKAYNWYPYIFSAALWPKNTPSEQFKQEIRTRFKSEYEKTNYEMAAESPFSRDSLFEELADLYSINTMLYADFIDRDGNGADGAEFRKWAFGISPPERFLWPYTTFLLKDGRKEQAFKILYQVRNMEGYGNFAEQILQKAISVINAENGIR